MKNYTNILITSLLVIIVNKNVKAQGIQFETNWEKAIEQAHIENKPLFVDVYATWCGPCKQMDKLVFSQTGIGEKFNSAFINIKIDGEQPIGKELVTKYGITAYPTYLFLTPTNEILQKVVGAMPPEKLLTEATTALSLARTYKPLHELEIAYKEGNREPRLLSDLLERKNTSEGRQPILLDEYLNVLPKNEFRTERVVTAISKNITSVESNAFSILVASLEQFQSMTSTQQHAVASGISTAKKLTFKKIVETNDRILLQKLIEVIHQTSYTREAAMAEEMQFRFDFAKITQDFNEFKRLALPQADYLMSKTNEELAFETQAAIKNFREDAQARNLSANSGQYQLVLSSLANGAEKATSYQLNDLAWGYVRMATDENDLKVATTWAKHAIELEASPANLDTYAHLKYRMNDKKGAIKTCKRAIKIAQKQGNSIVSLKESLAEFKK